MPLLISMQNGDISQTEIATALWDYRLFIDTEMPVLFKFCVQWNLIWLAKRIFSINERTQLQFEKNQTLNYQNTIVITHPNLLPLLEQIGPTILIQQDYKLANYPCNVLYTADKAWMLAHPNGCLVRKVVNRIKKASRKSDLFRARIFDTFDGN